MTKTPTGRIIRKIMKVTAKNLKSIIRKLEERLRKKLQCYTAPFSQGKNAYETISEVYDLSGKIYIYPTDEITPYITSAAVTSVQEVYEQLNDNYSIFYGVETYETFSEKKNDFIKFPAISVTVLVKEK